MIVRSLEPPDIPDWIAIRAKLWPIETLPELQEEGRRALVDEPPCVVLVAEDAGQVTGFVELGFRSYAEGCSSSPVPYVEGWFVAPDSRRRGVGTALMAASEAWARQAGYTEMGSDTQLVNHGSRAGHMALGFEQVEGLVVFRKAL